MAHETYCSVLNTICCALFLGNAINIDFFVSAEMSPVS